jgi:chitinase
MPMSHAPWKQRLLCSQNLALPVALLVAIGLSGCGSSRSGLSPNALTAMPDASSHSVSPSTSVADESVHPSSSPTSESTSARDDSNHYEPWHFHSKKPLLVGYLPDYDGSYADFAKSLDFSHMTHLYLAFGLPPQCNGTCTASSDMTFSLGQTDADIRTLVNAAHRAGVKVVLSIGGGGGDQQILQFYNAGLSEPLVRSLDKYLKAHNLDGVDLDIEDPNNMGDPYATFVSALVEKFRPQGKIITAAVAEYLQSSMPDRALHQFDFVNVMNYSNYSDAVEAMNFYSEQKGVPKKRITLGVPFFGQSADGNIEETYSTILAAYPDAWQSDVVSGGSLDNGEALYYVGEATMAKETHLGKQYGGIMIWELSQDGAPPHSLLTVIDKNL